MPTHREGIAGDDHAAEGAGLAVHGGLPQLFGVQLAQALEALDGTPLATQVADAFGRPHQVVQLHRIGGLGHQHEASGRRLNPESGLVLSAERNMMVRTAFRDMVWRCPP